MKLPRIVIEYQEEESFAFGKLSFSLILGFGIHFAWMFLAQFSIDDIFVTSSDASAAYRTAFYTHLLSLVCFSLTLFCYGLFLKQARKLFNTAAQRNRKRLIAACLTCLGTLCLYLVDATTVQGVFFILVSGVFTGVGSAVLLMSYGVSFSVCDIATIATSTACAFIIAPLAYLLITLVASVSPVAAGILTAAIPLGEFFCLKKCSFNLVDRLAFASSTLPVRLKRFGLHICVPSFLFGFAICGLRHDSVSLAYLTNAADPVVHAVWMLVACVVVCALILLVMLTQRQTINFMFRTLLPITAICIGIVVFFDSEHDFSGTTVLFAGYLLMEGALWMYYADISQRFRISAFQVFGLGRGALSIGTLVAVVMLQNPETSFGFDTAPMMAAVITLCAFIVAFAFLPTASELLRTLKFGRTCPAFLTMENVPPAPFAVKDAPAATPAETRIVEDAAAPEDDGCADSEVADTELEEGSYLPEDHADDHKVKLSQGVFRRKVDATANRYLLSKRETEVLFLLAKGRNAASIQEKLFISEGTARTHMRRIYGKLGVHSQKELMDLVESEEIPRDA